MGVQIYLLLLLEGWGVAASNLRGGSLSSSKERRRLLPASLGEAATSVGFAASMEEVAASVLRGWDSGMVVVVLSSNCCSS